MGNGLIVASPAGSHCAHGWIQVDWEITGIYDDPFTLSLSVEEKHRDLIPDDRSGDHIICGVLFKAMEEGKDLYVNGTVSPRLLDGIEIFQNIWRRWRPERYKIVAINATEECSPNKRVDHEQALFAFSGGVDATFSLFRHLLGHAGRNNRTPGAALLIHGLDIPLEDHDAYQGAVAKARNMLRGTGVDIITMRTNSRALNQNWEDSFGLQISGCFNFFQNFYKHAVSGSGEPYDTLVLPWGSTPLTDPLPSTELMQREHDGCLYDRTEKLQWLMQYTQITHNLRVCWEGSHLDRNCGRCEKCIRTMLNFWAAGYNVPECFPHNLTPSLVKSMKLRNDAQYRELRSLYLHGCTRHPLNDPIRHSVRYVLARSFIRVTLTKTLSRFRGQRRN